MDLVEEFARLGKALKWKIYYFIGFSAQASTLGVFFYLNKYASGLGSTNLCEGFFGLIFPTKRIFEPTVLLLKKAARCQPFLAVVRCLFHNHLRLKRSSLLNVYLNYKFEFSLLTSHLFFSLFILNIDFENRYRKVETKFLVYSFRLRRMRVRYLWKFLRRRYWAIDNGSSL